MDLSKYLAKPNKTIKEHTDELLESLEQVYQMGYIKNERIYNMTKLACNLHDTGKANKEFQKRVDPDTAPSKMNIEKEMFHNVLSIHFIDRELFDSDEDYLIIVHAVANHHNYCNVLETLREKRVLIEHALEGFSHFGFKKSHYGRLSKIAEHPDAVIIKGLLHKCDYSASAGYTIEYPNDFLETYLESMMGRWKAKHLESSWNDLQLFCADHRDQNIIAVAQTGMGKTEAGLLWIGNRKGFFFLPLRTAINAIYDRVRQEILCDENITERVSILHSNSLEFYAKNLNDMEAELFEYQNRGKRLSLPLNISTIDQLFDFVFKYQGYELKLATLSYAQVVIDEIQMYSPDLLAYLIYGLEQIHQFGGKIAIITATLPPFVKGLLKKSIPFCEDVFFTDSIRHNVRVMENKINCSDIFEKFQQNIELFRSNKILVVCNTVRKAQQIHEELSELLGADKSFLHILHSRFIRQDRSAKEKEILSFGKTYGEEGLLDHQSGIWISTSLVEASLDIDFDYLFTELQDINSLFQRFGRCNRKGVKDIHDNNCFVYTEIDEQYLKRNGRGFIDSTIYYLSKQAVSHLDGAVSEKEKIDLIDQYLTKDNLKGSDYLKEYNEKYQFVKDLRSYELDKGEEKLRNIFTEAIIPSPIYSDHAGQINDILEQLQSKELDQIMKAKLKDELYQFTVSVQATDVHHYSRAKAAGNAMIYPVLSLNKFEEIKVVECNYDHLGYSKMDFKNAIRKPEMP